MVPLVDDDQRLPNTVASLAEKAGDGDGLVTTPGRATALAWVTTVPAWVPKPRRMPSHSVSQGVAYR